MDFIKFRDLLSKHYSEMEGKYDSLFAVACDKDELYATYLASFPAGTNPMFRERTEHDCSCCRQFIKSIGNAVGIKDGEIETIWDFDCGDSGYQPVADALSAYIKGKQVADFYFHDSTSVGCFENYEKKEGSPDIKKWSHFYVRLGKKFVRPDISAKQGELRDVRNVFYRSLNEFSLESIETVLELITQNSLYRGNEWEESLKKLRDYKKAFIRLDADKESLFAWEKAMEAGFSVGKIRNHSIGTILIDINDGMDLDSAVTRYEKVVAPTNYKRPKAIFTKKMVEDAQKQITELGYSDSLARRFATLDDITVNNILFSNRDVAKEKSLDVFDELKSSANSKPMKFNKVEEMPIEKFISDVLPKTRELEVYFDGKNQKNLVSLIAPRNKGAKGMFKWNNAFSWAYKGNIADSIKQNVEKLGGNVTGDLRFSIQWNENGDNNNDFDAHCIEPNGNEIYFGDKYSYNTCGRLDVDIQQPREELSNGTAVENIFWESRHTMKDGKYLFFVHNYMHRGGTSGFSAEIEFDGNIYSFTYDRELRHYERVDVAEVTLKDGVFTIAEKLPSSASSREVWGIKTNSFVPVSVVMYSPNYWDAQDGIGNKHYMFMLKGCMNDEKPNGFFNEYLKGELEKHKRVFEALGSKMRCEDSSEQLSGLGFSATKRDELVVKVIGSVERLLKIKF